MKWYFSMTPNLSLAYLAEVDSPTDTCLTNIVVEAKLPSMNVLEPVSAR